MLYDKLFLNETDGPAEFLENCHPDLATKNPTPLAWIFRQIPLLEV